MYILKISGLHSVESRAPCLGKGNACFAGSIAQNVQPCEALCFRLVRFAEATWECLGIGSAEFGGPVCNFALYGRWKEHVHVKFCTLFAITLVSQEEERTINSSLGF